MRAIALILSAVVGSVSPSPGGALAPSREASPALGLAKGGRANGSAPMATFVGYRQVNDQTVVLSVELTAPVATELHESTGSLECRMKGARVPVRNNRNPLPAGRFGILVSRAQLVPSGRDVVLKVELREPVTVQTRVVPRPGGATLEVELTRKAQAS